VILAHVDPIWEHPSRRVTISSLSFVTAKAANVCRFERYELVPNHPYWSDGRISTIRSDGEKELDEWAALLTNQMLNNWFLISPKNRKGFVGCA
jgi:hypothetical protein